MPFWRGIGLDKGAFNKRFRHLYGHHGDGLVRRLYRLVGAEAKVPFASMAFKPFWK
jgi:hypothetical protein